MFLFNHRKRNYDINNTSSKNNDMKIGFCSNIMSNKLVKLMKNISIERRAFLFIFSLLILCIIAILVILLANVNKIDLIKAKLNSYLLNLNNSTHAFDSIDQTDDNQTLSVNVDFSNRSMFNLNNDTSFASTIMNNTNINSTANILNIKRDCGIRLIKDDLFNKPRKRRIVNSKNAKENYGWVVSIRFVYKNKKLSNHFCAGSLISSYYVITSANCIYQYNYDQIAVVIKNSTFYASELISHPDFNQSKTTLTPDIGLIKLETQVNLTDEINIVCLPDDSIKSDQIENKQVVVLGWGVKKNSRLIFAEVLQETNLNILEDESSLCSKHVTYDPATFYCAIDASDSSSNVCYGDAGGPLLYLSNDNWFLFGIQSFVTAHVNGSCAVTYPSYFTKILNYKQWIDYYLKF